MPQTPKYSLPYPTLADPPNGPQAFQQLATSVETALAAEEARNALTSGLSTARPAHKAGLLYYETDTKRIVLSTGTAWEIVHPAQQGRIELDVGTTRLDRVVTFPRAYTNRPNLQVSVECWDPGAVDWTPYNVNTTTFEIRLIRVRGTGTIPVVVNWIAQSSA